MLQTIWQALCYELGLGKQPDFFLNEKYHLIQDAYQKKCLDFGAGTCAFTCYLNAQGHQVIPVDIVDKSRYHIRPIIFDGFRLPFTDLSFDTSLCMFVLHHISHQDTVIRELSRVTKQYIVIAEDLVETSFDWFWTTLHTRTSPWAEAGNSFKSDEEWTRFFHRHQLQIKRKVLIPRHRIPYYPIRRAVYILERMISA